MKIRRFSGRDMRDAMRQVGDALGPDAVILDTEKLENGVAISAAIDFDFAQYERSRIAAPPGTVIDDTDDLEATVRIAQPEASQQDLNNDNQAEFASLQSEVASIRSLLEVQLARLIWDESERVSPERACMIRQLSALGLTPDTINRLVADLTPEELAARTWATPLARLVDALPVCETDLVLEGGVYAVVGPTGVGKTTSIAKLAARFAMANSSDDAALITIDNFRVGAAEQLETFGQILDMPVFRVGDADALTDTLRGLADKRLVLIDTAGVSQRDTNMGRQLQTLRQAQHPIDTLLALPANAQTATLKEVVARFAPAKPVANLLTKVDEAASLGGALSVLTAGSAPLAYITNGQRVPEDLYCARSRQAWLMKVAVERLPDSGDTDIDELAQRYVEVA